MRRFSSLEGRVNVIRLFVVFAFCIIGSNCATICPTAAVDEYFLFKHKIEANLEERHASFVKDTLIRYSFGGDVAALVGTFNNASDPSVNDPLPADYATSAAAVTLQSLRHEIGDAALENVFTLSSDGFLVASANTQVDPPPFYWGDTELFQTAFATCAGNVYTLEEENGLYVEIALPLLDDSYSIVGVIVWHIVEKGMACLPVSVSTQQVIDTLYDTSQISDRVAYLVHEVRLWVHNDVLIDECEESIELSIDAAVVTEYDLQWRTSLNSFGSSSDVLSEHQMSILNSTASLHLHELIETYDVRANMIQVFLLDQRGAVLGSTQLNPQYHYGQAPVFTTAFNDCAGQGYAGALEVYDAETGMQMQMVSIPVQNSHNAVTGVLVFGIEEAGIHCQKATSSLVDLLVIGKQVVEEQVGSDNSDLHETLLRFTDESLIYTYDQLLSEWAVNQQHGTDTIEELLVEDALWRSSIMDSEEDTARMGELLLNAGSDYLRELQQNLHVVGIEIVDIFMTDNRGAIVSMTRVAERYLYNNQTEFVQAFKNCSGHVYLRLADATHMILSAPVTDTSNTLVGVLVWQIRVTPPAENHYFVETYSAEAAFVISVSVIGLVFVGIVMATLVKYRALPKIRALSVPMMLCMCVGGSLGMSSSLFYVGNPTNFICTMRHWTLSLGIVMFIGGLVFKMGRIAKVFKHRSIREKAVLANKQMWLQYFFFCSIIGLTLIIFTAISPTTVHEDLNPFTHETDIFCVSALDGARNWVVITINAMLIFYGLYVIYETGKQKVEGRFDETKFLSIALYNVVGLTIFIAILEMTQIALHIVIIVKTMAVFCSVVISLGFSVLPRALSDVREISLSHTLTTSTKRAEILSRSSAAAVKRKSTTVMHNGKKRTIVRGDYLTKGVTAVKLVVGEKSSWSMPSRSMQSRTADSASHTKTATGSKSSLARPVSKSSPALSPKIAATSSPNASFILGSPCEPCEKKRGRSMTLRMKFHKDESVKCDHRKAGSGSNYRVKQESMKKTAASSSRLVEHGSFGRSPTSRTTLQVPSPQKSSSRSMSKRSRTNSMDQVSSSKDSDVSAEEDTTEELVKNMTNLAAASFSATSQ